MTVASSGHFLASRVCCTKEINRILAANLKFFTNTKIVLFRSLVFLRFFKKHILHSRAFNRRQNNLDPFFS